MTSSASGGSGGGAPGTTGPVGEPRHAPDAWHDLMTALGRRLPHKIQSANQHARNITLHVTRHAGRS